MHSENELLEGIHLIYTDGEIFQQQIRGFIFKKVLLNCRKAIINIDRVSSIFLPYQTLGIRR